MVLEEKLKKFFNFFAGIHKAGSLLLGEAFAPPKPVFGIFFKRVFRLPKTATFPKEELT